MYACASVLFGADVNDFGRKQHEEKIALLVLVPCHAVVGNFDGLLDQEKRR